jgi:hypothetical protein
MTSPYIAASAASRRTESQVRDMRHAPSPRGAVLAGGRCPSPPREDLPCPWCGSDPDHATLRAGRYLVGCESEGCPANPQVGGTTVTEAWAAWNTRAA